MNRMFFLEVPRIILVLLVWVAPLIAEDSFQTLVSFSRQFEHERLQANDAEVQTLDDGLEVRTGHEQRWPGVTIKAPHGVWDLSVLRTVAVELANPGDVSIKVFCRVDNPGADGKEHCLNGNISLAPRQSSTLYLNISPTPWLLSEPIEPNGLIGMRGNPEALDSDNFDPKQVSQIMFFVMAPKQAHRFQIKRIRVGGRLKGLDAERFIPFIDEYGQFIHDDWPGKTHSLTELQAQIEHERTDLITHSGPSDRNLYGGWATGPKFTATGFFYPKKVQGTWWLVDPEGCLFWSHGIDCVHASTSTPISDREDYFTDLPEAGSELTQFYGRGTWAPHGYYQTHTPYRTYDLNRANLLRKYGQDWNKTFNHLTHRRLRSWGLNTIANWSDSRIFLMRKTPYTDNLSFNAPVIEGSEGYWGKFYDVFDPAFRANFRKRLQGINNTSAGDPWCIGYFVHNEIAWGEELSLAQATLASPSEQPAKQMFLHDLKAKYQTIARLNEAWHTEHKRWEDLRQSKTQPDSPAAKEDLGLFYDKIADTYFRTIHDELANVAPNQLYFGCRFAWVNDRAARAAARYCDVVCYNRYAYSVADHRLPDEIDKPIIIGEFHFGALDRGMFHTGLRVTQSQADRAQKYRDYVYGALGNPYIVGTHWFQYKDQATTGRGDGENYQIGFLDICDRPNPEIVEAAREVGQRMYPLRMGQLK
jgi:hypothetical protein